MDAERITRQRAVSTGSGSTSLDERAVGQVQRRLSLFSATNLVVANMVGAGIFTTSGLLLAELGDARLMLALWLGGGLLALCGALCYGVLGAAIPEAGGEYVYLSRLYHPLFGFLSGWVSFFVGFSAPLAASAIGFAEYTAGAFGGAWFGFESRLVAALVIFLFTWLHVRGLRIGARVQNVLTLGKIGLIAGFVAVGFVFGEGRGMHFSVSPPGGEGPPWQTVGLSLMWIMFAYSGWNASGYVGSEIRDPGRTLPRSLVAGTSLVLVLYLLLNGLFVYGAGPEALSGEIAVGAVTAERLFGPAAGSLISALIAFALLSSISALIILGPRVTYAMARDRRFFPFAGRIHTTFGVPSGSIWLQGALACLLAVTGTFDQILTYMGFCLGIFPILAVLGIFRLPPQKRALLPGPIRWGAAVIFVSVSTVMLMLAYLERPIESSIALATILAGLPAYAAFRGAERRRGAVRPDRPGQAPLASDLPPSPIDTAER